jgi:hypothetical protein
MSNWSAWDWIAYGCLGVAALGLALGSWGKENPEMLERLPSLFSSPRLAPVPAILFIIATVIFIIRLVIPNSPTSLIVNNTAHPAVVAAPSPAISAQSQSVLVANRYYSAKNKEEVATFLDKISDAINTTGDQMLVLAEQALNNSPWDRPGENIEPYVKRMDDILALSIKMHIALYDQLLANEREYRVEMNSILFPKEPFAHFQNGANEFRNGLAVWMAMNSSVLNADRHGLFRLVNASRMTFSEARDKFLAWVSQRQDIIGQTRRALKS